MIGLIPTMVFAVGFGAGEVEAQGVRVRSSVSSNVYTWEVTNLGDSLIVRFEIPCHHAYNFKGPEGWEVSEDPSGFRAWTEDAILAIRPRRSGEFSARVTSLGAVLGSADARVELVSGDALRLEGLWSPVPEPRSTIWLIVGVILFLALLHTRGEARRAVGAAPSPRSP
jgi:hypothetical protein